MLFRTFMDPSGANSVGSALASMLIYILMALILVWKPTGLMGGAAS
jgi:branched-chain amino acid transport system permease protein